MKIKLYLISSLIAFSAMAEIAKIPDGAVFAQLDAASTNIVRKYSATDLLALADCIGKLQVLPMDGYWEECKAADMEDAKEGYTSGFSYRGHRRSGSASIMSRKAKPDASSCGPRLRSCMAKWQDVMEYNRECLERRGKAIDLLCSMMLLADAGDFFPAFSNIVERAKLNSEEAIRLDAAFQSHCENKSPVKPAGKHDIENAK